MNGLTLIPFLLALAYIPVHLILLRFSNRYPSFYDRRISRAKDFFNHVGWVMTRERQNSKGGK